MVRIDSDGVVLQIANTQLIDQKRDFSSIIFYLLTMLYRIIILFILWECAAYSIPRVMIFVCAARENTQN